MQAHISFSVLIISRMKQNRSYYTQANSFKRKWRNLSFSSNVTREPSGTSGADHPPISDVVSLTKDDAPTKSSAVLRSLRRQPGDMKPSMQAYKVSLIGPYCVKGKVVSCPLVILLLCCTQWMCTGNQSWYSFQLVIWYTRSIPNIANFLISFGVVQYFKFCLLASLVKLEPAYQLALVKLGGLARSGLS